MDDGFKARPGLATLPPLDERLGDDGSRLRQARGAQMHADAVEGALSRLRRHTGECRESTEAVFGC